MPDPSFYRECLEKSFEELKAAALKKPKIVKHKTKAEVATSLKGELSAIKEEVASLDQSKAAG